MIIMKFGMYVEREPFMLIMSQQFQHVCVSTFIIWKYRDKLVIIFVARHLFDRDSRKKSNEIYFYLERFLRKLKVLIIQSYYITGMIITKIQVNYDLLLHT